MINDDEDDYMTMLKNKRKREENIEDENEEQAIE